MTITDSSIRYYSYPRTEPPDDFAEDIANVFKEHESEIGTEHLSDGLKSDEVLDILREDFVNLGFNVVTGKRKDEKIK